jgi:hypothetical protein
VVASDHTPIGIPRNVRVHPGPSGRIFDAIDRKLEEVEWLLNYARNANKPIPVASAITTRKANAPRRLTPMRLLNLVTHHQKTKSAHAPKINSDRTGHWLFTGLQEAPLMRGITESMAGRAAILQLLPVSLAETGKANLLPGGPKCSRDPRLAASGSPPTCKHTWSGTCELLQMSVTS